MSINEKKILAEEYIEGQDIGGACLIREGSIVFFQLTKKYVSNRFVPFAHVVPSDITAPDMRKIKNIIRKLIKKFDIVNAIFDVDIRLSKNGPHIIRTGGKAWGWCNLHWYTIQKVDLVQEVINISLGIPPAIDVHYAGCHYAIGTIG